MIFRRALLAPFALAAAIAVESGVEGSTLLVANKSDNTVSLVELPSGEVRHTLPTGAGPHEVAVSPDGKTAVVANYGHREPGSSLTVIDVPSAEVVGTVELGEHRRPHGLAWLSNDRIAVTTEHSRRLLVVQPRKGKVLKSVATEQQVSHMVAATPDGRRAFVANIGSGSVTAIDLARGRKLRDVATGAGAEGIALTPDGKEVWVTNRAADTLSVLDAASLDVRATIECAGFPIRIAITPDGKRALVSSARSGEVVAFDVVERKELLRRKLELDKAEDASSRLFGDTFGGSPVPVGLLIAPSGDEAFVAATQADAVVRVNPETLSVEGIVRAGREPDGMAYSPLAAGPRTSPPGR